MYWRSSCFQISLRDVVWLFVPLVVTNTNYSTWDKHPSLNVSGVIPVSHAWQTRLISINNKSGNKAITGHVLITKNPWSNHCLLSRVGRVLTNKGLQGIVFSLELSKQLQLRQFHQDPSRMCLLHFREGLVADLVCVSYFNLTLNFILVTSLEIEGQSLIARCTLGLMQTDINTLISSYTQTPLIYLHRCDTCLWSTHITDIMCHHIHIKCNLSISVTSWHL